MDEWMDRKKNVDGRKIRNIHLSPKLFPSPAIHTYFLNIYYVLSFFKELGVSLCFTCHLSQNPVTKTETMSGIYLFFLCDEFKWRAFYVVKVVITVVEKLGKIV